MTLLPILDVEHASQYQRTTLIQPRKGSGLPSGYGLREIKLLGKGSNNAVYLYKTKHGQEVVVRKPRRKSDTQRVGNALGVSKHRDRRRNRRGARHVRRVVHAAHDDRPKGGLHIICDYYPKDMHTLLMESPEVISENTDEIASIVSKALRRMAENGLFCYDLKPSNMVVREDPKMDIKFIDFGRDFCEWRPYSDQNEHLDRAPILSFVQSLADDNANTRYPAKELYGTLYTSPCSSCSAPTLPTRSTKQHCVTAQLCRKRHPQLHGVHAQEPPRAGRCQAGASHQGDLAPTRHPRHAAPLHGTAQLRNEAMLLLRRVYALKCHRCDDATRVFVACSQGRYEVSQMGPAIVVHRLQG